MSSPTSTTAVVAVNLDELNQPYFQLGDKIGTSIVKTGDNKLRIPSML